MAIPYDPEEVKAALEEDLVFLNQRLAITIGDRLIVGTPVGNPTLWARAGAPPGYTGGHARRNWTMSVGFSRLDELAGEDASGARAASELRAEAKRIKRSDQNVVIQNNVPYAERLANGWSTQAPAGWVDGAIIGGVSAADSEAGKKSLPQSSKKKARPRSQQ